jgi:hypothetical protein
MNDNNSTKIYLHQLFTKESYIKYIDQFNNNEKDVKDYQDINKHEKRLGKSDNGEDGLLKYIVEKIGINNKYYVEYGAWDGTTSSNTYHFREKENWNGLNLEGNINKVNSISIEERTRINLHQEYVTEENINFLFKKYDVPKVFDILSIDIDSYDYYTWKGLTEYTPNIVIIEYNPGLPNDIPLVVDKKSETNHAERGYFGGNLLAYFLLAEEKGYKFVTTVRWNAIFVKKDLFHKLEINEISKDECIKNYFKPNKWWVNEVFHKRGFGNYDSWITFASLT